MSPKPLKEVEILEMFFFFEKFAVLFVVRFVHPPIAKFSAGVLFTTLAMHMFAAEPMDS